LIPHPWWCIKDYVLGHEEYPTGHVKLIDVGGYVSLLPAEGCIVECKIEDTGTGTYLYHVSPDTLKELGCDVGVCKLDYPFYDSEVKLIKEE